MEGGAEDNLKPLAPPGSITGAKARVEIPEGKLGARAFILAVGVLGLSLGRAKRLLNVAKIKPNQPIGEQDCWDAARAPEPVDRCFAYLEYIGKLLRSKVLDLLFPGVVRRIALARSRELVPGAGFVTIR